jgi:hypothetical protein
MGERRQFWRRVMGEDLIRYDLMVQDALRGVVRKVLQEAAEKGLPGEHHFFVSFRTKAPGVKVSTRLVERHPEEMTIVLQHQFWDLNVTATHLEVGLSFGGIPEKLVIPFEAITSFWDPSVDFGLKFELATADAADNDATDEATQTIENAEPVAKLTTPVEAKEAPAEQATTNTTEPQSGAEIVSLSAFRKKP